MAYDKDEIEKEALALLEQGEITTISELSIYLPCTEKTLRNLKILKLPSIKEALKKNKIKIKADMRKLWAKSQSATLQIANYKLLADKDEYQRLNGTKFTEKTEQKDTKPIKVVIEGKTHRLDE
jgi:hypothetical protein